MRTSLYSRNLDLEVTFTTAGGTYIYADINGGIGTLGRQICDGGHLTGATLSYAGEDQKEFDSICRRWFKKYIKNQSEN